MCTVTEPYVTVPQSACWSHDGQVLLFAMEGDPVLHAVKFGARHGGSCEPRFGPSGQVAESSGASTATVVADLTEVTLTSQDGEGVKQVFLLSVTVA